MSTTANVVNSFENNLARAFKIDVEKLLLSYEKEQTLSYDPFVKIWKGMTFSLIYGLVNKATATAINTAFPSCFSGNNVAAELKVFTELLFRITVKYLLTERSIFAQTGALYVLYGLYYKQPISCWLQIRLTYDQAKTLNKLINSLKENVAEEALYVYATLCSDDAFDYVASEFPRGLEFKYCRQEDAGQVFPYMTDEESVNSSLQRIMENDLVELEEVDALYQDELKKFKANTSVMLISHDSEQSIGVKLRGLVEEMQDPRRREEVEEEDSIKKRRRKLREKAQTTDVKSYRTKQKEVSKMLDRVRMTDKEEESD